MSAGKRPGAWDRRRRLGLSPNGVLGFDPLLARALGDINAALLLAHLDWESRGGELVDSTWEQIEESTTLTRSQQRTAREKLRRAGLVIEKEVRVGSVARLVYQVSQEAIDRVLTQRRCAPIARPGEQSPSPQTSAASGRDVDGYGSPVLRSEEGSAHEDVRTPEKEKRAAVPKEGRSSVAVDGAHAPTADELRKARAMYERMHKAANAKPFDRDEFDAAMDAVYSWSVSARLAVEERKKLDDECDDWTEEEAEIAALEAKEASARADRALNDQLEAEIAAGRVVSFSDHKRKREEQEYLELRRWLRGYMGKLMDGCVAAIGSSQTTAFSAVLEQLSKAINVTQGRLIELVEVPA